MGAEPVRRPGEAPREGVSSKNGWGWGGRNARDRCAGTGGWVGISEFVCPGQNGPGSQLSLGFENLVGGKKNC